MHETVFDKIYIFLGNFKCGDKSMPPVKKNQTDLKLFQDFVFKFAAFASDN